RGQPPRQLDRGGLVLALLRYREVRAAPVTAAGPRDGDDVPLAGRVLGLVLDVGHHPGRAGDGREAALLEAGVPLRGERGQPGRLVVRDRRDGLVPGGLHGRVAVHDDLAGLVVAALVRLRHDRVEDVARRVVPLDVLVRGVLEEVLPDL